MNKQSLLTTNVKKNARGPIAVFFSCILIIAVFYFSPIATGDDWETFQGASWRIINGQPLYGEKVTFAYYSNPPWVAAALLPISILPLRLGWAIICTANIAALLAVSLRWKLGIIKFILCLTSPPMFYILLHGQIDMAITAVICLPLCLWPLTALAKPQVAIGLLFGIPFRHWLSAGIVTGAVVVTSLFIFDNWPMLLIHQPQPFIKESHNIWLGLWPFQVPAGVALILLGISRRKETFLLAGSPLMMPYATISSLIGPWLATSTLFNNWQLFIVWISWWGVIFYRMG